ncbi:unnamed protein product [Trypanosoma congolense IL3000]|uniref:WGS project CAEQ00000000 data, annotated contig 7 n=1 Tax=Trypanosoma congolense (strain IL3000) TaxID=1068625 RepID=F9WI20_TRYCI|nr:unnamed protein product [Trypanosoma congolense IL3000]
MPNLGRCAFRYYEVMPVELEPSYAMGYDCDKCLKGFSKGPLFHCVKSGRDLCLSCGANVGLLPFSSLVSKVMWPCAVWMDAENYRVVTLCYQIHDDIIGCHFNDGSNLLISRSELSYFIEVNRTIDDAQRFSEDDLVARFPWASGIVEIMTVYAVSLHPLSTTKDLSRLCFLSSFRIEGPFIEFRLSDGFCELVHCDKGVIVVVRDTVPISCLTMNSPVKWSKVPPKVASPIIEWFLKDKEA